MTETRTDPLFHLPLPVPSPSPPLGPVWALLVINSLDFNKVQMAIPFPHTVGLNVTMGALLGALKLAILHNPRLRVMHNWYRSDQPSGGDNVVDQEMALLTDAGRGTMFERRSDSALMSLPRRGVVPFRVPRTVAARAERRARLHVGRPDVVHIHNALPLLSASVVAACPDVGVPAIVTLHHYGQVCPSGELYRAGRICTDCVSRVPLPSPRHGCYRGSRLATVPLRVNMVVNRRRRWWWGVLLLRLRSTAQDPHPGRDTGEAADRQAQLRRRSRRPPHRAEHPRALSRPDGRGEGPARPDRHLGLFAASIGRGVPLVLVGAGPLEGEIVRSVQDRDDVTYLGSRTKAECRELTARTVAVVASSTWMKSFGLVVVDDKVTGLGNAGSLVECLRWILGDGDRNRELNAVARRCYETQFTPETELANLVAGYEAAIAGRPCEPT